jgi:hypothetical protein
MSKLVGVLGVGVSGKSLLTEKATQIPVRGWRRKGNWPGATSACRRMLLRKTALRPTHALEALSHAAEYLIDSRMFLVMGGDPKAERDAVQVLMRLRRAVFQESPEVVRAGLEIRKAGVQSATAQARVG